MSVPVSFPAEVAAALISAGWRPDQRDEDKAREWGLRLAAHASRTGRRHTVSPAALDAYARYGGLTRPAPAGEDAAGEDLTLNAFVIDPLRVLHTVDSLAALAARIGVPLSPLGEEADGVSLLAIDEQGRVFALDHSGEWLLGESVEEALTTLVLGRRPSRVREDGTWA